MVTWRPSQSILAQNDSFGNERYIKVGLIKITFCVRWLVKYAGQRSRNGASLVVWYILLWGDHRVTNKLPHYQADFIKGTCYF